MLSKNNEIWLNRGHRKQFIESRGVGHVCARDILKKKIILPVITTFYSSTAQSFTSANKIKITLSSREIKALPHSTPSTSKNEPIEYKYISPNDMF